MSRRGALTAFGGVSVIRFTRVAIALSAEPVGLVDHVDQSGTSWSISQPRYTTTGQEVDGLRMGSMG